jgi:hypothetical protein
MLEIQVAGDGVARAAEIDLLDDIAEDIAANGAADELYKKRNDQFHLAPPGHDADATPHPRPHA